MNEKSKRCIEDEQDECDGKCAMMGKCIPGECTDGHCQCRECLENPNTGEAESLASLAGHQL